ncbi:hypothetical protein PISMIDRAFT_670066, partial [Pisolithus microcarpus 441]
MLQYCTTKNKSLYVSLTEAASYGCQGTSYVVKAGGLRASMVEIGTVLQVCCCSID